MSGQDSGTPSGVIVLGAGGRLGRILRRVWSSGQVAGRDITWVSRNPISSISTEKSVIWGPGASVAELPRGASVLALWGVTPGPGRDLDANVSLALDAQRLARRIGADRVLHCSSSAIYAPDARPQDETAPPAPPNAYGRAKREMEQALLARRGALPDDPRACVMRLTNIGAADSLFGSLDSGAPMVIDQFADGTGPARSYLAPLDLAAALRVLLTYPLEDLPALINLAGPAPVAMADLARTAGRAFDWRPAPAGAMPMVNLDTTLQTRLIGPLPDSADPQALIRQWQEFGEPAA
ncbi:NAD-dependent epimerase/dehydratase family protein [Pseudooceanicola nanhaiensis]|uniref:NAD-dependent epimerase/dehydratase family protein n=1 Tax=Pseudooceanicola nanhaiensis TaxID=375761 RepID=UPI001CD52628|nr:NAD-dependent epimerase/dehydratase family protein [Pseudooceanicola nanhaiensis]MCA0920378.1 NAD-dependent epimerase/dehydratase family protein [Pseudooceanicola nanhaiensis]